MSYSFYCSKCKKDHAGECPPEKIGKLGGSRWPVRAENGQRFRWSDGIHTIVDVSDDLRRCTLLCYGKPDRAIPYWDILEGCRPVGALEFVE